MRLVIGIRASSIEKLLNKDKCYNIVRQQLPKEDIQKDGFELDDYFYGGPFENLCDFLRHIDDTNTFTYDVDEFGESYLIYFLSYPWEMEEQISLEEVHQRLVDIIVQVTDLSRWQADDLIEDDICY